MSSLDRPGASLMLEASTFAMEAEGCGETPALDIWPAAGEEAPLAHAAIDYTHTHRHTHTDTRKTESAPRLAQ